MRVVGAHARFLLPPSGTLAVCALMAAVPTPIGQPSKTAFAICVNNGKVASFSVNVNAW